MKTVDLKKSELKSIINFFIEDLEYLLRESGESESRVPKKIRNLVENFYGRLVSYSKEFDKITKSKGEKLELNIINNFNSNKVKYSFVEEYIKKNVKYFQKLKKSDFISLNFDFVF